MLSTVVRSAVCPACCCLCDDIAITVREGRVDRVDNACPRGRDWFLTPPEEPAASASVDGVPAAFERAVEAAAAMLQAADYPLVYIMPDMATEAQRVAIAVADGLGAVVDTATSSGHAPSIMGMQHAGKVTCTLGETRNRANLIVFWGTNVVARYPRFFTRYSAEAVGKFVPRGRADRTCIAVDVAENETTRAVDRTYLIPPDADFEALHTLRSLIRGAPLDAEAVARQTGVPLAAWSELADAMTQARFGSIVFGTGLMHARGRHVNCEALFRLVADLNEHTRFVCRSIRAAGNVTGGDRVMTWQTGYPFAVNFARGFPRYGPGEFTVEDVLARGEADAALLVGGVASERLSDAAMDHLRRIPLVQIASRSDPVLCGETAENDISRVAIRTCTHGLHSAGTMYRMDDVPIRTRVVLRSTLPSETDVLQLLEQRLRETM